jgi:hypothetical protein
MLKAASILLLFLVASCQTQPERFRTIALEDSYTQAELDRCASLGGEIRMVGLDAQGCVYRPKDAGKACRDGSECTGSCEAPRDVPATTAVTGVCSDTSRRFGCANRVEDGKADGWVCAD